LESRDRRSRSFGWRVRILIVTSPDPSPQTPAQLLSEAHAKAHKLLADLHQEQSEWQSAPGDPIIAERGAVELKKVVAALEQLTKVLEKDCSDASAAVNHSQST
jgi:hypothetical protein